MNGLNDMTTYTTVCVCLSFASFCFQSDTASILSTTFHLLLLYLSLVPLSIIHTIVHTLLALDSTITTTTLSDSHINSSKRPSTSHGRFLNRPHSLVTSLTRDRSTVDLDHNQG